VTVARAALPGVSALFSTNASVATELTEHLVTTGRERLAFLGTPEPGSDVAQRYAGFASALKALGKKIPDPIPSPLDEAAAQKTAKRLVSAGISFDAIICGNDLLALAIVEALTDAGIRVPEDVAVTGWDDILAARYLTPKLTSVRQPLSQLAHQAVEQLHASLQGKAAPDEPTVIASTIVHRQSCCTNPDTQAFSHTP